MVEQVMTAKQHRMAKGFSVRTLASTAKVSPQTVMNLEKGKRVRPENARKIANVLGIEPMEIREYRDNVMGL